MEPPEDVLGVGGAQQVVVSARGRHLVPVREGTHDDVALTPLVIDAPHCQFERAEFAGVRAARCSARMRERADGGGRGGHLDCLQEN